MAEFIPRRYVKFLLASGMAAVALVATYAELNPRRDQMESTGNTFVPPASVDLMSRAERISKTGGVLIDYRVAAGVDCKSSSKLKLWQGPNKGKYFLDSVNQLEVDPEFDDVADTYLGTGNERTVFAGLDSGPDFEAYYPLISGWAIRHTVNSDSYTLYHFGDIESNGTIPIPEDVTRAKDGKIKIQNSAMPIGSIVGQQLMKFSSLDLALGQSYIWYDGQTSVTVGETPFTLTALRPDLLIDISCDPPLPEITDRR